MPSGLFSSNEQNSQPLPLRTAQAFGRGLASDEQERYYTGATHLFHRGTITVELFFLWRQRGTRRPQRLCPLPPHMNKLFVGFKKQIDPPERGLFIHDEVPQIPRARVFDPTKHSFNPLKDINYPIASYVVDVFDMLFTRGESTLTKDTGLDFIAEALDHVTNTVNLSDFLPTMSKKPTTGELWAHSKVKRILRSPVLRSVLCGKRDFFSSVQSPLILAHINRAELGDFDALVLGLFLIGQFKGQVVVPDFGFYGRDAHVSLIREDRLTAGLNRLDELKDTAPALRQDILSIADKEASGALYHDAVELAELAGLRPDFLRDDNPYNSFIDRAMGTR